MLHRKLVSRVLFVLAVARRPRSHKRVAAVEFMGLGVSKAFGSKICVILILLLLLVLLFIIITVKQ